MTEPWKVAMAVSLMIAGDAVKHVYMFNDTPQEVQDALDDVMDALIKVTVVSEGF